MARRLPPGREGSKSCRPHPVWVELPAEPQGSEKGELATCGWQWPVARASLAPLVTWRDGLQGVMGLGQELVDGARGASWVSR